MEITFDYKKRMVTNACEIMCDEQLTTDMLFPTLD